MSRVSFYTRPCDRLEPYDGKLSRTVLRGGAGSNASLLPDIRSEKDILKLVNRVKTKAVHFAWDNPNEDLTGHFARYLELTAIKNSRKRRVYVLTNYGSTHEQDLYRIYTLRDMGFDPYVTIYERPTAPQITRHLQRWVNNKRIFYSVPDFNDYIPAGKEVH